MGEYYLCGPKQNREEQQVPGGEFLKKGKQRERKGLSRLFKRGTGFSVRSGGAEKKVKKDLPEYLQKTERKWIFALPIRQQVERGL